MNEDTENEDEEQKMERRLKELEDLKQIVLRMGGLMDAGLVDQGIRKTILEAVKRGEINTLFEDPKPDTFMQELKDL